MAKPAWRRFGLLIMAFAVLGLGSPTPATTPATRVIVPGRPGEPATVGSSDTVKPPVTDPHTAADVWFVRMMIPHHGQAIEIAALAPQRARNPQIVAMAERMRAAQLPEILQLRAWLSARGLDEKDTGHDHADMPGMQSPATIRALADASGEQFDRMFVGVMSAHHRGAIEMAELRLRSGGDIMVERLASAIAFEQAVEINRMRDILGP